MMNPHLRFWGERKFDDELLDKKLDDESPTSVVLGVRLYTNRLTMIPARRLADLFSGLTKLELSGNEIRCIPKEIRLLTNLQHLYLNRNKLTFVPVELTECSKLMDLYLAKNQISYIPSLEKLTKLKLLWLEGNLLSKELEQGLSREEMYKICRAKSLQKVRNAVRCFCLCMHQTQMLPKDVATLIAKEYVWSCKDEDGETWAKIKY
jgi:Leucine-rich repeat (LRR) protein